MPKTLYLVDLDLTLINHRYEPTIPPDCVVCVAKELLGGGHRIGIISDAPAAVITRWMQTFGFRGPIVAERGACLIRESGRQDPVCERRVDWGKLRKIFEMRFTIAEPTIVVHDALHLDLFRNASTYAPGTPVVVCNPHRNYSMSMHVRRIGGLGEWEEDKVLLQLVVAETRRVLNEQALEWVEVDENPTYGVCILCDPQVQKVKAMPQVRNLYPQNRIVAIGDGITDLTLIGEVHEIWAVGNATSAFKEQADRIASAHITQGVVELLQSELDFERRGK